MLIAYSPLLVECRYSKPVVIWRRISTDERALVTKRFCKQMLLIVQAGNAKKRF